MRVGWIGLGAMGGPMAAQLVRAGHQVSGYDANPDRMTQLVQGSTTPALSIADAVQDCSVVFVMVATPDQAFDAVLGVGGAKEAIPRGAVAVISATVGAEAAIALEEGLAPFGVGVVDAPVSGGVKRAETGDLLAMVSGPPQLVEVVRPLLAAMTSNAPVVGESVGDGQRVKIVNQLLCGVHIAVAAEALALADAMGLDAQACWEILRQGAAASFMFDDRGGRMVKPPGETVNSALDIFVKDMRLVLAAADDAGMVTPLASAASRLYEAGAAAGLGRADDSSVIQVLRRPDSARSDGATTSPEEPSDALGG